MKIQFDEFGDSSIEMDVEQHHTEPDLEQQGLGLSMLLSGARPFRQGSLTMWAPRQNLCSKLEISIDAPQKGGLTLSGQLGYRSDFGSRAVKFYLTGYDAKSEYVVHSARPAKYWVLPLLNFIGSFEWPPQSLNEHPLRIFHTPTIPADLPLEEQQVATFIAHSGTQLIIFRFNGG